MARVYLSGASGFVGGELCRLLAGDDDHVIGLARSDAAAQSVTERGATPARGDVLDIGQVAEAMAGCDLAYHVAGVNSHCPEDPAEMMRVNAEGSENAVEAAARAGVRRLVLTSSSTTIGERQGVVAHEDTPHRGSFLSDYDESKHEGERRALAAAQRLGVDVVAVNPSSVQGPGRAGGTAKFILAYINGKLPVFMDVIVSVTDVADVARGHVLAAEHGRPGARYVLNGASVPSGDALRVVAEIAGIDYSVRMVPPALARGAAVAAETTARARGKTTSLCRARVRTLLHGHRYDASRSERELGLEYMPLSETVARIIDWAYEAGLLTRTLPRHRGLVDPR
ncbi:MAG: NAD-dependent epimerase/dehydratase family protein [Solirubrobacterales bacterium]